MSLLVDKQVLTVETFEQIEQATHARHSHVHGVEAFQTVGQFLLFCFQKAIFFVELSTFLYGLGLECVQVKSSNERRLS